MEFPFLLSYCMPSGLQLQRIILCLNDGKMLESVILYKFDIKTVVRQKINN